MKRQFHNSMESFGHRLAFPAAFIGSLFAIAMMLYAIDTAPVRTLLLP